MRIVVGGAGIVDYGTRRAVHRDTESVGLRSLKLTTRAGLGLCQGRTCGRPNFVEDDDQSTIASERKSV